MVLASLKPRRSKDEGKWAAFDGSYKFTGQRYGGGGTSGAAASPAGAEPTGDERGSPATSKSERGDDGELGKSAGSSVQQTDGAGASTAGQEAQEGGDGNSVIATSEPPRDLWAAAWNSEEVGEKRRAVLKGKMKSQEQVVNRVIENTKVRMASYRARWGSDDEKTALGSARTIMTAVLKVKDLIDSALKFDPTGYGAAAWTVVSFGLSLVQNDKEQMELTFEACSFLADLLARYSRIQAHYWTRKVKDGVPIEEAMIKLYTAILVYAAEVQESAGSGSFIRVRNAFISLTGQPLEELKKKVEEEDKKVEAWQQQIDRGRWDDADKNLENIEKNTNIMLGGMKDIAGTSTATLSQAKEEELRELYKWLLDKEGKSQSSTHQKLQKEVEWWETAGDTGKGKGKRSSAAGTVIADSDDERGQGSKTGGFASRESSDDEDEAQGSAAGGYSRGEDQEHDGGQSDELADWLLQKGEFQEWKRYPQGLLWLHGNSGCGKSLLCSTIIKKLNKAFLGVDARTKVLAYWYFCSDMDETKRMDLLLLALLRQLASKAQGFADDKSLKWFRQQQDSGQLPDDVNDLFSHLKRLITKVEKDVFIVLDGLDHVPDRQRVAKNGPLKLLDIVKRLARQGYPNLHLLLVSRDEEDIRRSLETNMKDMLVEVKVEQHLGKVLGRLVERKLRDLRVLKGNETLMEEVQRRLGHEKYINFRWAASVLRQVSRCRDAQEVRETLQRIPDDIVTIYQAALEQVAANDAKRMKHLLLWMLRQQRALSKAELAAAIGLDSPAVIMEICTCVLVETSRQAVIVTGSELVLDIVRFTHFSVREYLEAVVYGWRGKPEPKADKIARFASCSSEDAHLQMTRRCLDILTGCVTRSGRKGARHEVGATSRRPEYDSDSAASTSGTRMASGFDAGSRWDSDTTDGAEADDLGTNDGTSRPRAESRCSEWPARKNAAEHWFHHYNEIDRKQASSRQLKGLDGEICLFLLDNKRLRFWLETHDPDGSPSGTGYRNGDNMPSPMYYAVKLKLGCIPVQLISAMVKEGSPATQLDLRGRDGTALQLAAHEGDIDTLDALIKHGADVNARKGKHGTALYASAAKGNSDAVERLLVVPAKADDNDQGDFGSPLHVAAFRGHETVVQLLLKDNRVPVNYTADPFGTALQAAAASRCGAVVKMLLDHGADPNIVGGCLGTALLAAYTDADRPYNDRRDQEVWEALEPREARLPRTPSFWANAYRRATSPNFIMYGREMPRHLHSEVYTRLLLRYPRPGSQVVGELSPSLQLLSRVIQQWTLPTADFGEVDRLFGPGLFLCRVPFQDQLDRIQRAAASRPGLAERHLRNWDFMYEALFWAGINYILGELPDLMRECLGRVSSMLMLEFEGKQHALLSHSPVFPFRLAFRHFGNDSYRARLGHDDDAWPRRTLFHKLHGRRRWKWICDRSDVRYLDAWEIKNPTDRSDHLAMELEQRRQRHRRLEEFLEFSLGDRPSGREFGEAEVREELRLASTSGVWVLSDILDLVENLIDCGGRCVRYQDATSASEAAAPELQGLIEDLTFELFLTVIRLALMLHDCGRVLEDLVHPVQLLTTVRLKRIKQLDATLQRASLFNGTCCTHKRPENIPDSKNIVKEMSDAVARRVEQEIGEKFAAAQTGMVREIQTQVSKVIKEETSHLVQAMQEHMEEKMREKVKRQVAEALAAQPRRGLLWGWPA